MPSEFMVLLSDVLHPLTSSDPQAKRRGMDLFFTPSFARVLEAAEAAEAARHRYRVLGPARITRGDRTVRTLAPRQQALLCMLLLRRGRPVTHFDLTDHLLKEAGRITRRHPLRRAGAAQRAVHEGLRRWPVPGLSVACSVRLRESAPPPGSPPSAPG
ncbi:hypothetical protein [Streptomyces sp. NPDC060027]|uniref:hypothetical protein n=1 Tax=Streptomyces sp. NPDC060027 TaxID=3347040 RepID=UPI0036ACBA15